MNFDFDRVYVVIETEHLGGLLCILGIPVVQKLILCPA